LHVSKSRHGAPNVFRVASKIPCLRIETWDSASYETVFV
jgi:hypothetical protein